MTNKHVIRLNDIKSLIMLPFTLEIIGSSHCVEFIDIDSYYEFRYTYVFKKYGKWKVFSIFGDDVNGKFTIAVEDPNGGNPDEE